MCMIQMQKIIAPVKIQLRQRAIFITKNLKSTIRIKILDNNPNLNNLSQAKAATLISKKHPISKLTDLDSSKSD